MSAEMKSPRNIGKVGLLPTGMALGVLVMGAWVGQLEWVKRHSTTVYLPVRGFDPRDLLSGRYLRYALDLGQSKVCTNDAKESGDVCVCLGGGATLGAPVDYSPGECSGERSIKCKVHLKGRCEFGTFRGGFERYYFPEEYARDLFTVPQNAAVRAHITTSGQVVVDEMYVGDKVLIEHLREVREKRYEEESKAADLTPTPTAVSQ